MLKQKNRKAETTKRHRRLRLRVTGSAERPRLAIFRSGKHIYAQVIDDVVGHTLMTASSLELLKSKQIDKGWNLAAAEAVGALIAKKATGAGIKSVVYDRGGFLYHGRVAALASKAREGGLEF
jgi:large subunit ribosomal protein L18